MWFFHKLRMESFDWFGEILDCKRLEKMKEMFVNEIFVKEITQLILV